MLWVTRSILCLHPGGGVLCIMTTYSEKLKDPRWQKKRLEVLESDGWTCQSCNETELQLQVHHLKYDFNKEPWDYNVDDLITLCCDCHESVTSWKKDIKKSIENLKPNSDMMFFYGTIIRNISGMKLNQLRQVCLLTQQIKNKNNRNGL